MPWSKILMLAVLPAFLLLDVFSTRPSGARTRWWRTRALLVTAINFALALVVGKAWANWMGGVHVLNGAALGTPAGAVAGVLVYEFFHYWYHRMAHRFDWLWRLGHQMHHSAETLDPWGAYYLHPIDAVLFTTLSNLVLFPLLGLTPEAGGWAAAALTFLAIFEHASMRTPRWLGYFIQRPESHAIHHQRGVHAFNYADIPLWDMLFGTYRNPAAASSAPPLLGFHEGASARLAAMLLFRDVSKPRA